MFASAALALVLPVLTGAVPFSLSARQNSDKCSAFTDGNTPSTAACPLLAGVIGDLYYAAESTELLTTQVFQAVGQILPANNPVAEIPTILTEGFLDNVVLDVSATLEDVAATLQNVFGQCKCDMSTCNSHLEEAQKNTAAGTQNQEASCQQAKFACGQFYSSAQVDKYIPACAKYDSAINN